MVAARKVRATNRAFKQNVTDDGELRFRVEKDDMPWGMAWAVAHLEYDLAKLDAVAILQPAIWRKRLHVWESEHSALFGQGVDPELIVAVWSLNRNPQQFLEFRNGTCMVNVCVGYQDLLDLRASCIGAFEYSFSFATGIHYRSLVCVLTAKE